MNQPIEVERRQNAVIIRFNRPESRNPISTAMIDALWLAIRSAESGGALKVVFTGQGGFFASGADLTEIMSLSRAEAAGFSKRGQDLMAGLEQHPLETVAAINGACYGGALDLALACERRIASPDATFCHPGVRLGIITGWGGTQRLPRLVGEAYALQLFLTAEPVDAEWALRAGLIDAIATDPLDHALTTSKLA